MKTPESACKHYWKVVAGTVAMGALGIGLVAGCSSDSSSSTPPAAPASGGTVTVYSDNGSGVGDPNVVVKHCDGTTLLYVAETYHGVGISAVPNSPECKGKP